MTQYLPIGSLPEKGGRRKSDEGVRLSSGLEGVARSHPLLPAHFHSGFLAEPLVKLLGFAGVGWLQFCTASVCGDAPWKRALPCAQASEPAFWARLKK